MHTIECVLHANVYYMHTIEYVLHAYNRICIHAYNRMCITFTILADRNKVHVGGILLYIMYIFIKVPYCSHCGDP